MLSSVKAPSSDCGFTYWQKPENWLQPLAPQNNQWPLGPALYPCPDALFCLSLVNLPHFSWDPRISKFHSPTWADAGCHLFRGWETYAQGHNSETGTLLGKSFPKLKQQGNPPGDHTIVNGGCRPVSAVVRTQKRTSCPSISRDVTLLSSGEKRN